MPFASIFRIRGGHFWNQFPTSHSQLVNPWLNNMIITELRVDWHWPCQGGRNWAFLSWRFLPSNTCARGLRGCQLYFKWTMGPRLDPERLAWPGPSVSLRWPLWLWLETRGKRDRFEMMFFSVWELLRKNRIRLYRDPSVYDTLHGKHFRCHCPETFKTKPDLNKPSHRGVPCHVP